VPKVASEVGGYRNPELVVLVSFLFDVPRAARELKSGTPNVAPCRTARGRFI
jgi:hypothetical protein